jgi:signal transduction histidine kinase
MVAAFARPATRQWLSEPVRRVTDTERRRATSVLGRPIQLSARSPSVTRRETGWMAVHACAGIVLPLLVAMLWLTVAFALSVPLWWWAVPRGDVSIVIPVRTWPEALLQAPLYAIAVAAILTWLATRLAQFEGWYAERLLGPSSETELAERVASLTQTRAEALEAHGAELRRIERDLHDGTQAQLVTAALRLGLAERRFEENPAAARALMLEARTGMENALTDLRAVIRGIYPPILSDRGLAGAVRALAAGRPMPVSIDIPEPDRRCPAAVEAAAYFVVAEGLTNVARHSGAAHATVSILHSGPELMILVRDDGRGGADPRRGSGLAGIRRRVAALDGVTRIDSREGTTLEVRLPCGL